MADINKIGLLLLSSDRIKFLVCEKDRLDVTSDFIMPGGQVEDGEGDKECLVREIKEELEVEIDFAVGLKYVGEYIDVAAGLPGKYVSIKLYKGNVIGDPKPSQEIIRLHWIGKEGNPRLSPIIRNKILPDLIVKGIII